MFVSQSTNIDTVKSRYTSTGCRQNGIKGIYSGILGKQSGMLGKYSVVWQIQWYLGNYSGNLGKYYNLYLGIYKLVQSLTSISINFQPFTGTFHDLYKLVVTYLKLLFQGEGWVNKHNNHNFFRSDSCHER